MNIEALKKQLIIDEGCKLEVYLDSLGKPTFGIGHLLTNRDIEWFAFQTISKGKPGMKISQERVDQVFAKDIAITISDCKKYFSEFDILPEEVQQIIANMMFNLGRPKLLKLESFVTAIKEKNYKLAAQRMKAFLWYKQVGDRAKRLVARMEKVANDILCQA